MSAMVRARLPGSSASGGFGRPWATSQKLQRRVQTSPRIMNVAVPWLKHSWMFGQLASSQTVTSRFSRSLDLSFCTALPAGMRTRIQLGLRKVGADSSNFTGLRAILSPPSCFTPACSDAGAFESITARGMDLRSVLMRVSKSGGRGDGQAFRQCGDGLRVQPQLRGEVFHQHRRHRRQRAGAAAV